jgi:hypothetical protein
VHFSARDVLHTWPRELCALIVLYAECIHDVKFFAPFPPSYSTPVQVTWPEPKRTSAFAGVASAPASDPAIPPLIIELIPRDNGAQALVHMRQGAVRDVSPLNAMGTATFVSRHAKCKVMFRLLTPDHASFQQWYGGGGMRDGGGVMIQSLSLCVCACMSSVVDSSTACRIIDCFDPAFIPARLPSPSASVLTPSALYASIGTPPLSEVPRARGASFSTSLSLTAGGMRPATPSITPPLPSSAAAAGTLGAPAGITSKPFALTVNECVYIPLPPPPSATSSHSPLPVTRPSISALPPLNSNRPGTASSSSSSAASAAPSPLPAPLALDEYVFEAEALSAAAIGALFSDECSETVIRALLGRASMLQLTFSPHEEKKRFGITISPHDGRQYAPAVHYFFPHSTTTPGAIAPPPYPSVEIYSNTFQRITLNVLERGLQQVIVSLTVVG